MVKIQIKRVKTGWYFRVVARNGRIVCHSEVYTRKDNCYKGLDVIRGLTPRNYRIEEI